MLCNAQNKQNKELNRHFGSQTEPVTRNGELCEDGYPKSPLCTNGRFRINELTSNVPYAVRSVLWNDDKGKQCENLKV